MCASVIPGAAGLIFCCPFFFRGNTSISTDITLAVKYLKVVIPAEAGIQKNTGCRIKSGMTEFGYLLAGLITL